MRTAKNPNPDEAQISHLRFAISSERNSDSPNLQAVLDGLLQTLVSPRELLADIHAKLTQREREVLFTFLLRLRNKEVANRLGTREQTIRNQISAIRKKLNIESPIKLVALVLLALFRDRIGSCKVCTSIYGT